MYATFPYVLQYNSVKQSNEVREMRIINVVHKVLMLTYKYSYLSL
jgi:hypothetical protein